MNVAESRWASREVAVAAVAGLAAMGVAAVALKAFRDHQALMAKSPFLRAQQPFMRRAIEALPVDQQQLLQAAYEAQLMAGVNELQIQAIDLAGAESRLWDADQWLTWLGSEPELGNDLSDLFERGAYMLDAPRLARAWAQTGPQEELVQIGAALHKLAPKESVSWNPQQWMDWLGKDADRLCHLWEPLSEATGLELLPMQQQLAIACFVRRHRQVYAHFVKSARQTAGQQWESWTSQQWFAHIKPAPNNYYHSMYNSMRPLIATESSFHNLFPDSPLSCHYQAENFVELLASDLATRRDLVPLGLLQHESSLWQQRCAAWSEQLIEEAKELLELLHGDEPDTMGLSELSRGLGGKWSRPCSGRLWALHLEPSALPASPAAAAAA